ncbi:MAG: hypothetical protein WA747_08855 [Steroidobacteraceae bacterium]
MAEQKPQEPQLPQEPRQPDSRRGALIGLLVTAALVILGLILVKVLGDAGRLQDCAMSGRTNCAPINTDTPQQ